MLIVTRHFPIRIAQHGIKCVHPSPHDLSRKPDSYLGALSCKHSLQARVSPNFQGIREASYLMLSVTSMFEGEIERVLLAHTRDHAGHY